MVTARESELRYLRKNVIDQEQEISVLDKHIENMNNGVIKLASNTEQIQFGNIKYEQYLSKLRILYCDALANIPLPGKYYFKLINLYNFISLM